MTMKQIEKAIAFKNMHFEKQPLVLYNIWDVGSARAVAQAGAGAIATGSLSVAAAQGYDDGQNIPMSFALQLASRIIALVDLPVTVDFEGAYAENIEDIEVNVAQLIDTGAVGLNFEDQIIGGEGLYATEIQASRIEAVRNAANAKDIPLLINARTDLFLKADKDVDHASLIEEAVARAVSYAEAGADCFFVPMLSEPALIEEVCKRSPLPVNVMVLDTTEDIAPYRDMGVARVSFGPAPYLAANRALTEAAQKLY